MKTSEMTKTLILFGACTAVGVVSASFLSRKPEPEAQQRATASAGRSEASADLADSRHPHAGFWESLQMVADESEGYPTLSEMGKAADAVVVGTLSNFRVSRVIPTSDAEIKINMLAVDLNVAQQVRGRVVPKVATLEFYVPGRWTRAELEQLVADQTRTLPRQPVLAFLRSTELGMFRIVNSHGLWIDAEGGVRPPLSIEWLSGKTPEPVVGEPKRVIPDAKELARQKAAIAAHQSMRPTPSRAQVDEPAASTESVQGASDKPLYADDVARVRSIQELAASLK